MKNYGYNIITTITRLSLPREFLTFFVIGCLQFGIDSLLLLFYVHLGLPIAISNILSRASAAVCGYMMNAFFNFGRHRSNFNQYSAGRFLILWVALTAVSTLAVSAVVLFAISKSNFFGLAIAKIIIELTLFIVSYSVCKHWVYCL